MTAFADRLVRAARLDARLYEEVEADRDATGQALLVVVLSSLAAGAGFAIYGDHPLARALYGLAAALVGWAVWALATYAAGALLFPEPGTHSDPGELLRTIGFSSAPGLLRVLGFVPVLGLVAVVTAWLWMGAAMVLAVRQALDYRSTARAVAVCLLGWVAQSVVWLPLWMAPALLGLTKR